MADLGDAASARLLRTALRTGFRASGGPFRSLAGLAVEPRSYQYVPLLLALRQDTVRLLIADDVGIGKTIEAGLIAAELIAQGDIERLAVLCSPALAEQWQRELREKFAIDAELLLPSTATRLSRGLMLNESLFDRYPFVVISTDFVKNPNRRYEFLNHCPEMVIVDEAHGAVADSGGTGTHTRHQRYELLRDVASDRSRHLVLVTATPHSGKEEGFRNLLGLLDPELATIDLDQVSGRARLAQHFVQRRRGHIRRYLDEETAFPSDRRNKEAPYRLSPDYAAFFDRVLDYAHDQVTATEPGSDGTAPAVRQRVRWWSALALLRALASSPDAAAATLRTRAAAADATTLEEAEALGRAGVLDRGDDETLEAIDTTPGADLSISDDTDRPETSDRRRLLALARTVDALVGPDKDRKLATLIAEVKGLLADGYDPIVFCRFIHTAVYVARHLDGALGRNVQVAAVTGTLPPELREQRIAELTDLPGRHVLVATDCLSEGVNLQEDFQAVIHYDLAWNPTRHEQREGRVDRFGQTRDIVRAITIYGRDNRIDGIVLDVLIRKFEAIRTATGVSIPVPDSSGDVVEALIEGLVLRGRVDPDQLVFDLGLAAQRDELHREWESAAERERLSRTKYAQEAIHPEEVDREVTAARDALGTNAEIEQFTIEALAALGTSMTPTPSGYSAVTQTLPIGLRDALPPGRPEPLPFDRDLPAPRGHAVLTRTDPAVEAVARYMLDTALDVTAAGDIGARGVAARAGITRTRAVQRRTTLLLARFRFHLDLPARHGVRQLISEEARFLAFAGAPDSAEWLTEDQVDQLLGARPDANVAADQAAALIERVITGLPATEDTLNTRADQLASDLLDAHRRVRAGSGAPRRGLAVTAQKPVDVLGVYLFLPVADQ